MHVDTTDDGDETKAERDADIIIDRALREDVTEGASEELLIQLANTYAEGTHKDRDTAYNSVLNALAAYARLKSAGSGDNSADALHNAIMAEVAALNDAGELDNADARLEDVERAMKAAHQNEQARKEQQIANMLNNRIAQDRLRDRPDLAAGRLIQNLRDHRMGGTLFSAIDKKADEWSEQGNNDGDLFTLQVALNIAKTNYETVKKKSGLAALALYTLGWCHLRLAMRSSNQRHLVVARNAFQEAIKKTNKSKDEFNWGGYQSGLGNVLQEMGKRDADTDLLEQSITCNRAALKIALKHKSDNARHDYNNLGIALSILGEFSQNAAPLREAIENLQSALTLSNKKADPVDWATTKGNLALAQRHLGALTKDLEMLKTARNSYATCEALDYRDEAPFDWTRLQWNIADLELAHHHIAPDPALLTSARAHLADARAFFVVGSEYQTTQCDELLEKINQAAAST